MRINIFANSDDNEKYYNNYNMSYLEEENLFLNPDGTRTRFPIGWNGHGRYAPGSLKLFDNTNGGIEMDKALYGEEDNGVFFNFASPLAAGKYTDITVKYICRKKDYEFSTGVKGSKYEGEEYFLFPNWKNGKGCGDAFWVGKYLASHADAVAGATAQGSSAVPTSRKNVSPWTNIAHNTTNAQIKSNKGGIFHTMRNREWNNIILWDKEMNIKVDGNIYGYVNSSLTSVDEAGTNMSAYGADSNYKTRTGMGPVTWNHNGKEGGIADLVGNVWEGVYGLQLIGGVYYIFDEKNENLVSTGLNSPFSGQNNADYTYICNSTDMEIECLPYGSGIDITGYTGTNHRRYWYYTSSTRVLYRGGSCVDGLNCGLFPCALYDEPTNSNWPNGFRLVASLR